MKKSKLNALLFTSLCLIIMSTGCGQQQTNDNKSKTESETSATNLSEDVSGNSNEGIDVAVEEEKPPYDFLVKWSDFSYQGSFIDLKNSIKSPIHVESSDLMNKSGYTFLEVPSLYCAIDGITPDVILPYPTEKEWYSVGCISDDTIAYMGGSASCVFHLTDITSYKEGETITLELKLSEKTDFTDK